jgi:hypothetical protein
MSNIESVLCEQSNSIGYSEVLSLLSKNLDIHLNIVWTSNALLLGAIGWLITSKEARDFIGSNKYVWLSSQITLVLMFFFHVVFLGCTFHYSEELYKLICETEKLELVIKNNVFFYRIPLKVFILRIFVTSVFFLFLYLIIFKTKYKHT